MRKNTLKEIWASGGATLNGWCSIPSSFSAEIMAHQGFDSITIDMQHGLVDYPDAVTMLQAISTTDVIPMTRVPWSDPGRLMKILDAGSYGVICPMINTAEDAEYLVQGVQVPAVGLPQLRPHPRQVLRRRRHARRRRLPHLRRRGDPGHPADRDARGDQEPRRDPRGPRHRRHLHRPLGPLHGAGPGAAQGPDRPRVHRGGRDDPCGRQAPRRARGHPHQLGGRGRADDQAGVPVHLAAERRPLPHAAGQAGSGRGPGRPGAGRRDGRCDDDLSRREVRGRGAFADAYFALAARGGRVGRPTALLEAAAASSPGCTATTAAWSTRAATAARRPSPTTWSATTARRSRSDTGLQPARLLAERPHRDHDRRQQRPLATTRSSSTSCARSPGPATPWSPSAPAGDSENIVRAVAWAKEQRHPGHRHDRLLGRTLRGARGRQSARGRAQLRRRSRTSTSRSCTSSPSTSARRTWTRPRSSSAASSAAASCSSSRKHSSSSCPSRSSPTGCSEGSAAAPRRRTCC